MQERAYTQRGEQYLLIKSPPASGKSRALMFLALDKLHRQNLRQAVIAVPERTIGASFNDQKLTDYGFWADWEIAPRWNLCAASGPEDGGTVNAVGAFLASAERILLCTHATLRFALERFGVEAFDQCLLAVDEFHHVSANPDNKLGAQIGALMARNQVHIIAMTGSYFRGDAQPVLLPEDEARFQTVTYTYYEQLDGYQYLKHLDIAYYFYSGVYSADLLKVLDPHEKTIIHIPSVNSRESTKDKQREVEHIMEALGAWQGTDAATGFQLVRSKEGRLLRVADLVDDDPIKRDKVVAALKDPAQQANREYLDIIIALGMAKEGFDWVWCEHALTIGYRASLTEVVQIIGRTTRDAPGKTRARFSNLIAALDGSQQEVTEAVNDTLKAIAASLLMEQVLAPRFDFKPKLPSNKAEEGFDYGANGYQPDQSNVGYNAEIGKIQIEIKGLSMPHTPLGQRIIHEDINEIVASLVQDKEALERGLFDEDLVPEEISIGRASKIIRSKYPELDAHDQEAVRQHALAAFSMMQNPARIVSSTPSDTAAPNTAFIDGVRRFITDVRDLDVDFIDRINPFARAYAILGKTMNAESLQQLAEVIGAKRRPITPEDAWDYAKEAHKWKAQRGRPPSRTAFDPWERLLADGASAFMRFQRDGCYLKR